MSKRGVAIIVILAFLCLPALLRAEPGDTRSFGDWRVQLISRNNVSYACIWTTLLGTDTEFEILLNLNQGYRYYEPQHRYELAFTRLIDPVIYKTYYQSPDEIKKIGSFMLDEKIYPVGLASSETGVNGDLLTFVNHAPEDFLDLLDQCHSLIFRQVNGISYLISVNGLKEALAHAFQLANDYFDLTKHPCYPLVHRTKY